MRLRLFLISLMCLGLALALACSGSGSSTAGAKGNVALRLGSDSFPGYSQVVVSLEKVEASADGGATWLPLGNVKATYDLMALQNGNSAEILPTTQVDAKSYSHFRLTWATQNYNVPVNLPGYVVPTGGTGQPLALSTVTVVRGPVSVSANGNTTALIMLSGQQAVQARTAGTTTTRAFQATAQAYNVASTARITGQVRDAVGPLAGVEIFVETVDGAGLATLQRRAFTNSAGNYILEGLPIGSLYFLVVQPGSAATAYAAVASAPVNAAATATYNADLVLGSTQAPGALTLDITPASTATQGTWGELRQTLSTGGTGSQILIVRSQTVATTAAQDQAAFIGLAPGTYGVAAQRSTSGAAPVMKAGSQVLVSAGATATTTLSFP